MLMPVLETGLTSPRLRDKRFCARCSSFGSLAGSSCTAHLRAVSLPGASLPNGDLFIFFFIIWTFLISCRGRFVSAALGFTAWDGATGAVQKETHESPAELVSARGGSSAAGVDRVEQ